MTLHSNSFTNFLIRERTNIIISFFTGIVSGLVVSQYFSSIQKRIDTHDYIKTLIDKLIFIKNGINEYFKYSSESSLEEYLAKDNSINRGFHKYKRYMDKNMLNFVKKAVECRNNSELTYKNIKRSLKAIEEFEKDITEIKKIEYLTIENRDKMIEDKQSYIRSFNKQIEEDKKVLKENENLINDLIEKIFLEQKNL